MRTRMQQLVVTFSSTVQAMAWEDAAASAGLPGRLIPVPREVAAGCGLAYKAPPESRAALEALLTEHRLSIEKIILLEL